VRADVTGMSRFQAPLLLVAILLSESHADGAVEHLTLDYVRHQRGVLFGLAERWRFFIALVVSI
jgi:hypothetical protein